MQIPQTLATSPNYQLIQLSFFSNSDVCMEMQ